MSFNLKLERAREHLNDFEAEAGAWINTEPYGVVDEPDPEPPPEPIPDTYRPRRFRIIRVSQVPERLSIVVGDCVFNLRSALDHLALALAKANKPRMTQREIQKSEFPIFQADNPQKEREKIGCIAAPAQAIIKALQPYHRGNGYSSHPLWQIHELNRIDKHRSLTVCAALPMLNGTRGVSLQPDRFENFRINERSDYAYVVVSKEIEFKLNAVWMRWAGKPIDPNQEMSMNPTAPIEIVFGQEGPASFESVIPTLNALCDFVGNVVIAQLAKFL